MQPYFERVWGWDSHSRNGNLGVHWDSQNFKVQWQGSKHFALRAFFIFIRKLSKCRCRKWLAWAIWTSAAQVMAKKRSEVKLIVWLPTTKSQELTRPRCVQVKWNTPLESSQWELQLCFEPHHNQKYEQKVIVSQSCRSSNHGSFGTPLWESQDKKPFGCGCCEEAQRIQYGGKWWLPPSLGRGESYESKVTCGLS